MMIDKISIPTLLLLVASSGYAQSDSVASQPCWRGSPAPDCTSFVITEVGYQQVVTTVQLRQAGTATTDQPLSSEQLVRTASGYTTSPHRTDYGLTGGVYVVSSDIIKLSAHADMLVTGGKPRLSLSIVPASGPT